MTSGRCRSRKVVFWHINTCEVSCHRVLDCQCQNRIDFFRSLDSGAKTSHAEVKNPSVRWTRLHLHCDPRACRSLTHGIFEGGNGRYIRSMHEDRQDWSFGTIYKEGHLGASRTRGKHMDAMWCHVKCHVRRRACEAVGRPCRACEAPWVWAEPARPPVRLSCVEHRETLPACR